MIKTRTYFFKKRPGNNPKKLFFKGSVIKVSKMSIMWMIIEINNTLDTQISLVLLFKILEKQDSQLWLQLYNIKTSKYL